MKGDHYKNFREINFLETSLVKTLIWRKFQFSKLGDNVSLYGQKIRQNDAMIPYGVKSISR